MCCLNNVLLVDILFSPHFAFCIPECPWELHCQISICIHENILRLKSSNSVNQFSIGQENSTLQRKISQQFSFAPKIYKFLVMNEADEERLSSEVWFEAQTEMKRHQRHVTDTHDRIWQKTCCGEARPCQRQWRFLRRAKVIPPINLLHNNLTLETKTFTILLTKSLASVTCF